MSNLLFNLLVRGKGSQAQSKSERAREENVDDERELEESFGPAE